MFFLNEENHQLENLLLKLPIDCIIEMIKQYLQSLNTISFKTRILRSKSSKNHRHILLQHLQTKWLAHSDEKVLSTFPCFCIVVSYSQKNVREVVLYRLEQLGRVIVVVFVVQGVQVLEYHQFVVFATAKCFVFLNDADYLAMLALMQFLKQK